MQMTAKKFRTILLGTVIILIIIFINSGKGGFAGEKGEKEDSREYAALEEALMQIEGIGEVSLYFHYDLSESTGVLTDYFTLSNTSSKKGNQLQGILVIAEGAENFKVRNDLTRILSTVLQLPEHRIVVETKKRGNINENE